MNDEIMVSIDCIAYNHEKYIAESLDSFLMQKTSFRYEILVHDDASSDGTAAIIREYERKYPDIIKPIYQIENQYSKGKKVGMINRERAKGKYIAICEGDDYWTDPYKLQKQFDYMEANPSCALCIHAANKIDADSGILMYEIRPGVTNRMFTVEEVIKGGGGMCATNSMFFPAALIRKMPGFYYNSPIGDYPLAIHLALQGETFYFDCNMSVYRYLSSGSWTKRTITNKNRMIEMHNALIRLLHEVNEYTDSRYAETINETILFHEYSIALANYDRRELKKDKYKELYGKLTAVQKLAYYMDSHFPELIRFMIKIRSKLRII